MPSTFCHFFVFLHMGLRSLWSKSFLVKIIESITKNGYNTPNNRIRSNAPPSYYYDSLGTK